MADNERLEVWLAPIEGTTLFVPHRILIGTKFGALVIEATRFVVVTGLRTDEQQGHADGPAPQ